MVAELACAHVRPWWLLLCLVRPVDPGGEVML
jgi:hypothetical protein